MTELRAQLQGSFGTECAIERELGGRMSRVFVARDTAMRRRLAP